MTGFEPATSSPPAKRATKLRHIPTCEEVLTFREPFWQVIVFNCFFEAKRGEIDGNSRLTNGLGSASLSFLLPLLPL